MKQTESEVAIAEAKHRLLVMEAAQRGEVTQWFSRDDGGWVDDTAPFSSCGVSVRIKPKPREWWMLTNLSGVLELHLTPLDAKNASDGFHETVHIREVTEGE